MKAGLDLLGALLEPGCNLLQANPMRGDRKGKVTQLPSLCLNDITLSFKPGRHRIHRSSLVPIDEAVVQNQALGNGRSTLERGVI